ncbi:DUF4253 domain-containing protein, partial [Streptomyces sp. OS603R]|uniref:DUF4253 domain-containing protein n=1 Tax=Streptomyces sp. OS603R TaxID=3035287 RepID=UPI0024360639
SVIRHQRAVQEALFLCAQHPATTRSGLPFDAHPSRSKRQQLLTAEHYLACPDVFYVDPDLDWSTYHEDLMKRREWWFWWD